MWSLGIDIGGTAIKVAVVDDQGETWYESVNATQLGNGLAPFVGELVQAIKEATDAARSRGIEILDVGIGVPGLVENNRIVGGINNIPILDGVALDTELGGHIDLPVRVENDVYFMGVAESRFGAAQGVDNVVFLTVGTGIGSALLLNGQFYRGKNKRACEIGHMVLAYGGEPCSCGNEGCFEALASMSALVKRYSARASARPLKEFGMQTGPEIVRRYLEGEKAAADAFNWHFDHLACGIGSLVNIFGPEKVVIGGGITESGDFYLDELLKRVPDHAIAASLEGVTIDRAVLGNKAGCIGAACDGMTAGNKQEREELDAKAG